MPLILDCPMDEVLAEMLGDAPLHWSAASVGPSLPPPPDAKGNPGQSLGAELESENFYLTWADPQVTDAQAEEISERLEAAWGELILVQGWTLPPTADQWRVRVQLEPELGVSGVTALVEAEGMDEPIPLIRLSPDYSVDSDFNRHVVVHEFVHAVQLALRDPSQAEEGWYWEASAEWGAATVAFDDGVWLQQAYNLRDSLQRRYSDTDGGREYGFSVLNAWLDEHSAGMKTVWDRAAARPEASWAELLQDGTGTPIERMWSDFLLTWAADGLEDAWPLPEPARLVADQGGVVDELGAVLLVAEGSGWLDVEGPVHLSTDTVVAGDVVAVVGLEDGAIWTLQAYFDDEEPGCGGCASHQSGPPWWALLGLLLLRRR